MNEYFLVLLYTQKGYNVNGADGAHAWLRDNEVVLSARVYFHSTCDLGLRSER